MTVKPNFLFLTDGYKISHHLLYPPKTTKLYSYFESRGGEYDGVLFYGLQIVLKKWLEGCVVTNEMVEEAEKFFKGPPGIPSVFNASGWRYIVSAHGGRLPLRIKAVTEGNVYPTKNVLVTVENTDPKGKDSHRK